MPWRSLTLSFAVIANACNASQATAPQPTPQTLAEFVARVDTVRAQLRIPGMGAIVMIRDSVVWEGALGLADIAASTPVTPSTGFHLASLTKTFASTIIMQLVEQGTISLDDPVSQYGVTLPSTGIIRVRHLMSHTSEGTPGAAFRYNGDRFALLTQVILQASGETFARRVHERIVVPLGLMRTAPNPQHVAFTVTGGDAEAFTAAMATGYGLDANRAPMKVAYPSLFGAAAGLVSTARDVATYSVALDAGQFLTHATRELAYTPAIGANNRTLPYALGWFVSEISGEKIVWHYGYWTGNSSLIIKVPARALTFVVLTNSDQLSAPFSLGSGNLMSSPIAQLFVKGFVTGPLREP